MIFPQQAPSEFLHAILENSNQAIMAYDEEGKVIYSNSLARKYDLLNDDLVFYQVDGVYPLKKEDLPYHRALKGEEVKNLEIVLSLNEQVPLFFLANAKCLYDASSRKMGVMLTLQDITETKHATERLSSRFQAIFEQSPFSIQLLSKDGRTLRVNPAYQKLWAVSDEIVENYVYKTYNLLEDKLLEASGQLSTIKKGFAGEIVDVPPFYYDPVLLGLKGRARWAGGLVYPLKDSQGNVQEVVIIHNDVTDQYEANEEKKKLLDQLTAERNRLATILGRMPAGVMVAEAPDGRITFRNERMLEMENKSPQTKNFSEYLNYKIVFPDGRPYSYKDFPAIRSLTSGEVINDEELTVIYSNEEKAVFSVNSAPLKNPEGKITDCVVVTNDITEKKRIEGIQNFLDHMKSVLLTTLDMEHTSEELSKACVPFLADGCYVDLLEGDELRRIITHHHDYKMKNALEKIGERFPPGKNSAHLSTKVIQKGELVYIKEMDNQVLQSLSYNQEHLELVNKLNLKSVITLPLRIRGKNFGVICFFMNTSGRIFDDMDIKTCIEVGKHAALAIDNSKLYREAQSAVKLRDDFISLASHELKTPITSVNLQIEVLSSIIKEIETKESKYAIKVMGDAHRQIERLSRLVDDMLDISRIATGKLSIVKQEMDLAKVAREALDRFADQMTSLGIKYHFSSSGPVMIQGDPIRLDQVVTNFITNAIRYGNRTPIEISVYTENNRAFLQVKDHGRGIPLADQERIFDRFERSHASQTSPGLGLGLYINRQIINEHGGNIRVESEPEKGATFIIEL